MVKKWHFFTRMVTTGCLEEKLTSLWLALQGRTKAFHFLTGFICLVSWFLGLTTQQNHHHADLLLVPVVEAIWSYQKEFDTSDIL
mmetsp:Transcript_20779/g.57696  ORF Transcript_20779/g.57696 Transcript_20779/m.57696 type:complete len:85 (+) Transcript_20779:296-550(+)